MLERLMVPLDGSELAECALPYAETLAKGCSTKEVILISVTERITGRTHSPEIKELYTKSDEPGLSARESGIDITYGKKEKQAMRYLERIAKNLNGKGIQTRTEVLIGDPATEIVNFAKCDADLIVMSSHGRSGPSRWAFGSVAERVFRASRVPILMIRGPGCVATL